MKPGEMESFSLPWGYELTLYDEDGMNGNSKSYYGTQNTDDNEFMDCINVEDDWRNRARSFSVRKFQNIGSAKVYWTHFTATEGIKVAVHYGFQSDESETTTDIQENTLSYEMGGSIEFGDTEEEWKMTETYRQETEQSATHSMTYSFDLTYKVGCKHKPGVEGVGLWQQVTEGTDSKFRVWSTDTVCRYGDKWQTAPACPYAACLDPECNHCADDWKA